VTDGLFYFNGVDGATSSYLVSPLAPETVSERARGRPPDAAHLDELRWWHERATEAVFGPGEGLDPRDLAQVGWGVVFARGADPALRDALEELLSHRRRQAAAVHENHYREFWGEDGLRPGESKAQFLARHGAGPGPVDPARVPYYLLLVGSGREIPFSVQYQLDVQYAVGRLAFDSPDEYARYAASVVSAENGAVRRVRSIGFFAPQNDRATALSRTELVEPLMHRLTADHGDWKVRTAIADDATKTCLVDMLGGATTPSMLFTAGHGLGWPSGHPHQVGRQGGLVCQEWPGPGSGDEVSAEQYVVADDIPDDAAVHGLIAFHFACFGAGTPEFDDFAHRDGSAARGRLAPAPMVSGLPRRLLGHPRGGALAVAGHVDRAWSYSFAWPGAARQTEVYRSCLERLLQGQPIGSAFDYVNERYAELSSDLSAALEDVKYGRRPDHVALSTMWTANNDARGFVVLGDPAVRLPGPPDPTGLDVERDTATVSTRATPDADSGTQPNEQHGDGVPNDRSQARRRLVAAMERLASVLEHAADGLAEIEVVTSSGANPSPESDDPATEGVRISSRSTLAGDVRTVVLQREGAIEPELWPHHFEVLRQAQAERLELMRTLGPLLGELLDALGVRR
jgi:hypothetical protein